MSKQRLSGLQKTILKYLYDKKRRIILEYSFVRSEVGKLYGAKGTSTHFITSIFSPDEIFKSSFSRSIRQLSQRGLVNLTYCASQPKYTWHKIKICNGRHPQTDKPCKNCSYFEKFDFDPDTIEERIIGSDFIVENGKCLFSWVKPVNFNKSTFNPYRRKVDNIKLTPTGEVVARNLIARNKNTKDINH